MEAYLGRAVVKKVVFNSPTDGNRFRNLYDASAWCGDFGYSHGQPCRNKPMAIKIGVWDWIAKWKNLTKQEQKDIDGVMVKTHNDGYEILLFKVAPVQKDIAA